VLLPPFAFALGYVVDLAITVADVGTKYPALVVVIVGEVMDVFGVKDVFGIDVNLAGAFVRILVGVMVVGIEIGTVAVVVATALIGTGNVAVAVAVVVAVVVVAVVVDSETLVKGILDAGASVVWDVCTNRGCVVMPAPTAVDVLLLETVPTTNGDGVAVRLPLSSRVTPIATAVIKSDTVGVVVVPVTGGVVVGVVGVDAGAVLGSVAVGVGSDVVGWGADVVSIPSPSVLFSFSISASSFVSTAASFSFSGVGAFFFFGGVGSGLMGCAPGKYFSINLSDSVNKRKLCISLVPSSKIVFEW